MSEVAEVFNRGFPKNLGEQMPVAFPIEDNVTWHNSEHMRSNKAA